MWFQVKSLHLVYALLNAIYHRHGVFKTSPRHRQDISNMPRRIADMCMSHAKGLPTIADSISTSLTASQCSAE